MSESNPPPKQTCFRCGKELVTAAGPDGAVAGGVVFRSLNMYGSAVWDPPYGGVVGPPEIGAKYNLRLAACDGCLGEAAGAVQQVAAVTTTKTTVVPWEITKGEK